MIISRNFAAVALSLPRSISFRPLSASSFNSSFVPAVTVAAECSRHPPCFAFDCTFLQLEAFVWLNFASFCFFHRRRRSLQLNFHFFSLSTRSFTVGSASSCDLIISTFVAKLAGKTRDSNNEHVLIMKSGVCTVFWVRHRDFAARLAISRLGKSKKTWR